jgi:hypothetical protein
MKKNYSQFFILACLLLSMLFIASTVAAQVAPPKRGSFSRGMRQWWKNPRAIKAIEITAEQQQTLNELSLNKKKEIIKLNADKQIKRLDLSAEMRKIRPDIKKVKEIVASISSIDGKIRSIVFTGIVEGMNVLSEEQVEKLQDFMTRIRAQGQQMRRQRMQGLMKQRLQQDQGNKRDK